MKDGIKAGEMVIIALLLVMIVGGGFWVYHSISVKDEVVVPDGVEGVACDLDTTQNIQQHSVDFAKQGTAVAATTTDVYKGGNDGMIIKVDLAPDTNHPTEPNTKYTFFTDKANYFAYVESKVTPCQATVVYVPKMAAIDSSTVTFINSDGVTKNVNATGQEAIGAGETVTVTVRLKGAAAYKYMANNVLNAFTVSIECGDVADMDTSNFQLRWATGGSCKKASVPIAEAGSDHVAFECEGNIYNFEQKDLLLTIDAGSGANPADGEDLIISVYPHDYWQHTETGAIGSGVEDDAGSACETALTGTLYIE